MLEQVRLTLKNLSFPLQDEIIVAAVSGGVDSMVMLHCLHQLQNEFGYELHVATFDHTLRGEVSAADMAFVVEMARQRGLEVTTGSADVKTYSETERISIEAAARQARYTFLVDTALELDAGLIAVGHHRDDQVETVLMHLIRGTGLAGLRGMLLEAPLSESHVYPDIDDELYDALENLILIRPLLNVPRAEIRQFAAENNIPSREDETNQDRSALRNRLRHEIIPLLTDINSEFQEATARTALILQGDYTIVQQKVDQFISRSVEWDETTEGEIAYIDRIAFCKESRAAQRHVLRRVITDLMGDGDLTYARIEEACDLIAAGEAGQRLSLPLDLQLRVGYDEFTVYYGGEMPFPRHLPQLPAGRVVPLSLEGQGYISEGMRFYTYWVLDHRSQEIYRDNPLEASLAVHPDDELNLRTRKEGDRFCPLGMEGHSQKLSDTFTNLKVPQPFRDRIPLLTINGEIAWFVAPTASGVQGRIAEKYAVKADTESVLRVRWEVVESQ